LLFYELFHEAVAALNREKMIAQAAQSERAWAFLAYFVGQQVGDPPGPDRRASLGSGMAEKRLCIRVILLPEPIDDNVLLMSTKHFRRKEYYEHSFY